MIRSITALSAALLLTMSVSVSMAHAQLETPPQPLTGAVIGETEAAILQGFFQRLGEVKKSGDADTTVGGIVKDVLDIATAGRTGDAANDDATGGDAGDQTNKKKDKGKNKAKDKNKNKSKAKNKAKNKGRGQGLPPGLQRQLADTGSLPPGLQKKLEATGALPPGLVAKGLPRDLEAALPNLPEGQQRIVVDDDLLIIEQATGAVLDALPDIIPPEIVPILKTLPDLIDAQ